ncbi:cysteine and histidine-rich domain-containing protein [Sporobolomyces koalae]|uniref:cysteine and histidine-rich domain-containing protein n=1 Tax=Sporobolomyces koalae TaxID=500713 RepID=UPI0031816FBC
MSTTIKCTRNGCGKQFDPLVNDTAACSFHPGHPVFHEGLKSWSCCSSTNKPTTDFDDFVKFEPCASGTHSHEPAQPSRPAPSSSTVTATATTTNGTTETYGIAPQTVAPTPAATSSRSTSLKAPPKPQSTPYVELQDDPEIPLVEGMTCKRKSCGKSYQGSDMDRTADECQYHPGVPIFHEGSKGMSCCKRRVLDFDEFLNIEGCRTGRHMFVGPKTASQGEEEEERVECRMDHYQTPKQVIVSIFAKQCDASKSLISFESETMSIDLKLPNNKRFEKSIELFGPIVPSESTYKVLGTKCEVVLIKQDSTSWPSVAKPTSPSGFVPQLAFSAGGGRGTCGAKEAVLDETNRGSRR